MLIEEGIVRQCTAQAMVNGNFCDYQELNNSADGNSLDIRISNDFDVEIIQFWDHIFELTERKLSRHSTIASF